MTPEERKNLPKKRVNRDEAVGAREANESG